MISCLPGSTPPWVADSNSEARAAGGCGGGSNPDFRYNAIVSEETTKGRCSGVGFGLHNDVVAPYLPRLATEEQKQRWLPKLVPGS